MGCVIWGKSLDLSGLRLLTCKLGIVSSVSCFSVCSFVEQISTDVYYFPGSVLGAEDTAGKPWCLLSRGFRDRREMNPQTDVN